MRVTLYTEPNCPECDEVRLLLNQLAGKHDLAVTEVSAGPDGVHPPVVQVEDVRVGRLVSPITEPELHAYLHVAEVAVKDGAFPYVPAAPGSGSILSVYQETTLDRVARFLGRNWLKFMAVGLGIFSILPWLAPIFAALGWWGVADPIYTVYAIQCHQLPEREAHIFGYEVCQCWRCNALYGGMFIFSLVFMGTRNKDLALFKWMKKPLPAWVFILFLVPMAIDGFTHMFGLREPSDPGVPAVFGSFLIGSQMFSLNWILRIVTGLLAAVASIWFSLPRMQRAMDEAEALRTMYLRSSVMRQSQT